MNDRGAGDTRCQDVPGEQGGRRQEPATLSDQATPTSGWAPSLLRRISDWVGRVRVAWASG